MFCCAIVALTLTLCMNVLPRSTTDAKEINTMSMTTEKVHSIVSCSSFSAVDGNLHQLKLEYTYGDEVLVPYGCVWIADENVLIYRPPATTNAEYIFKVDTIMHKKTLTLDIANLDYEYSGQEYDIADDITLVGVEPEDNVELILSGTTKAVNAGDYRLDCYIEHNEYYTFEPVSLEWNIARKNISHMDFEIDASFGYTGKPITPSVILDGLTSDDYLVMYENNVSIGKATIKVVGMGNYTGVLVKTFNISSQHLNNSTITVVQVNAPVNRVLVIVVIALALALILMVTIFVVKVANKRKFGRIDYYT